MDTQFRRHVLRRDWKSAIQILKAALEIDRKDPVALSQLADQRNRFLTAADPLIGKARLLMTNGDRAAVEELAGKFDNDFPEWSELADTDEALWGLWVATRKRVATTSPETAETPEKPVADIASKVAKIRKILDRAQPASLTALSKAALENLEDEVEQAKHEVDASPDLAGILERDVSSCCDNVRVRIKEMGGRSILQMIAIALLSIGGLIAGAAICWALLQSAHLKVATDFLKILGQCIAYLVGSPGHQFVETAVAALGVSALSYWIFLAAPRLWNRAFVLRDGHHMIFIAATIIIFFLSDLYVAVDFMDPVAKEDIQKWHDKAVEAQSNDVAGGHYDAADALTDFEQQHPFLGSRLRGDRLNEGPTARSKPTVDAVSNIENASNYLNEQTRVVLPNIQSDTEITILVLFIAMMLGLFAAISFAAYRSLKVTP